MLHVANTTEGHQPVSSTGSEPVGTNAGISPGISAPDANIDVSPDGVVLP